MDPINLFKIISAICLVIVAIICGYKIIKSNPKYWLNRFYALFFIFVALGFLLYMIYHMIFDNASIIIPIMIISQIILNLGLVLLLMATFIIIHSERVAMTPKYYGISITIFILSIMGYFIWNSELDLEEYASGNVTTNSDPIWFIIVNIIRVGIIVYVFLNYFVLLKKTEGLNKKRMKIFTNTMLIAIIGVLCVLFGGSISIIGDYIQIAGSFFFMIAEIFMVRAFSLKEASA